MCPRPAPTSVQEFRVTLGDFERRELVKPISDILDQTNESLLHARYLAYATLAVGGVSAITIAWFVGKGLAGIWDDAKDIGESLKGWGLPLGPLGELFGSPKWTPFDTSD